MTHIKIVYSFQAGRRHPTETATEPVRVPGPPGPGQPLQIVHLSNIKKTKNIIKWVCARQVERGSLAESINSCCATMLRYTHTHTPTYIHVISIPIKTFQKLFLQLPRAFVLSQRKFYVFFSWLVLILTYFVVVFTIFYSFDWKGNEIYLYIK